MAELISLEEEKKLLGKLVSYYENLYPGITFEKKEVLLTIKDIGNVLYTFPGEQAAATAKEYVEEIIKAFKKGYDTPVIILRKEEGADILLDGHRRLQAAWKKQVSWKAFAIIPDKKTEFGIEKMILGKVRELWG